MVKLTREQTVVLQKVISVADGGKLKVLKNKGEV